MGARICAVAVAAFGRPLLLRSFALQPHPDRSSRQNLRLVCHRTLQHPIKSLRLPLFPELIPSVLLHLPPPPPLSLQQLPTVFCFSLHLVPPAEVCGAYAGAAEVSFLRSPPIPRPHQRGPRHRPVWPGHRAEGCGGRTVDGNGVCWVRSGCL